MAVETVIFVDGADSITSVAGDAERHNGNCRAMVMTMAWGIGWEYLGLGVGKVVGPMALNTGGILGDGDDPWPVGRTLQYRRNGTDMAVAALLGMDSHWVARCMTADTEGCVENMA